MRIFTGRREREAASERYCVCNSSYSVSSNKPAGAIEVIVGEVIVGGVGGAGLGGLPSVGRFWAKLWPANASVASRTATCICKAHSEN